MSYENGLCQDLNPPLHVTSGEPFKGHQWDGGRIAWGHSLPIDARFSAALAFSKVGLRDSQLHLAVGQNQWCHFGVGAPP